MELATGHCPTGKLRRRARHRTLAIATHTAITGTLLALGACDEPRFEILSTRGVHLGADTAMASNTLDSSQLGIAFNKRCRWLEAWWESVDASGAKRLCSLTVQRSRYVRAPQQVSLRYALSYPKAIENGGKARVELHCDDQSATGDVTIPTGLEIAAFSQQTCAGGPDGSIIAYSMSLREPQGKVILTATIAGARDQQRALTVQLVLRCRG